MITQLTDDHDRIRAIAADLERYLDGDIAPGDRRFTQCRLELMRVLSTHLAFERYAIGNLEYRPRGRDLASGLDVALDQALRDHMLEWTGTAIHKQWDRYRAATRDLLTRLRARMRYEETAVFPALAANSATTSSSVSAAKHVTR